MPDDATGSTDPAGPVTPIRVLIVDDHEVLASSLAHVLDAEPDLLAVGIAGTVQRARELITTTSPDVVLLDHRLPDGDGVSAIGEPRRLCSLGLNSPIRSVNAVNALSGGPATTTR